jgi:hypothetical protein
MLSIEDIKAMNIISITIGRLILNMMERPKMYLNSTTAMGMTTMLVRASFNNSFMAYFFRFDMLNCGQVEGICLLCQEEK